MFIIYQPPAYNRIEGVVNGNFKSFWTLKDSDEKLFDKYYKNFYDDNNCPEFPTSPLAS